MKRMGLLIITALSCFSSSTLFAKKGDRCVVLVSTGFDNNGLSKIAVKLSKQANAIVRSQIASWSPHTAERGSVVLQGYMLPPTIMREHLEIFFTQGMNIDCKKILSEIKAAKDKEINLEDRLWISSRAHVIMPYHCLLGELDNKKGRRKAYDFSAERRGISWCDADKRLRGGIRIADLMDGKNRNNRIKEEVEHANIIIKEVYGGTPLDVKAIQKDFAEYAIQLKPYVKDNIEIILNQMLAAGKSVIIEATGGTFLDVGLGTVPFVSSSATTAAGACAGAGIGPKRVGEVIGVMKAYSTRSGKGPFPTETNDSVIIDRFKKINKHNLLEKKKNVIPFAAASNEIQQNCEILCECDTNVRFGWLDLVLVRQAILINSIDTLALTMLDGLDDFDEILVCYDYVLDGKNIDYLPPLVTDALRVKPRYMKFKGWKCSTQQAKRFSDLPEEARYFIKKIELLCNNTPIDYISVGPDNSQTIVVQGSLVL